MSECAGKTRTRLDLYLLLAVLAVALLANRAAYSGYFEDDDLDTMTWARLVPLKDLLLNVPSLRYPPEHARPLGYFYYGAMIRSAGLDYPAWVAVLQAIHVLNILLLWLLLRRLGLNGWPLAAACLFFAMHRALFDAWWKPMFIYDLLCTTFALASVLAYLHQKWVLSFLAFWLALRTKEIGLCVPAMLACCEMWQGRNWKRLIPFCIPAAVYGGYGLYYNLHLRSGHLYTLHAGPAALWKSLSFYMSRMFWIPYAGFLLLLAPWMKDRRLNFGVALALCGLGLYLLLPGRLLEIYLYLALVGTAVAIGAVAARKPALVALALLLWIPWQYLRLRKQASVTLPRAADRQAFVEALRQIPDAPVYVYTSAPASLQSWGVEGALRLVHKDVRAIYRSGDAGVPAVGPRVQFGWDDKAQRLRVDAVE